MRRRADPALKYRDYTPKNQSISVFTMSMRAWCTTGLCTRWGERLNLPVPTLYL